MTASKSANAPQSPSNESQVTAFWAYIRSMAPNFTLSSALEIIAQLQPIPDDPKVLAKHLSQALQRYGVRIKHMSALQAASRVHGARSWYAAEDKSQPLLRFMALDKDRYDEQTFDSWSSLAEELREWADRLLARGQLPLGILQLSFAEHSVQLMAPVPASEPDKSPELWPLGTITYAHNRDGWLSGAPAAFEKLRRHLEENGKAVLDGYSVLKLCARSNEPTNSPLAVGLNDVVNSELVLMREDNEDDPRSAYEIARGNEITCWHQLELSLRDDATRNLPALKVTVPTEGVGTWYANGIRYTWSLETLKPRDYVPGRTVEQIGISECEQLLRRYRQAKRIQGHGFKYHEQTKSVEYLSRPPEEYRVDLHFILHKLQSAGLTWEAYCEKFADEAIPMSDKLPIGFVWGMLKNLNIEQINHVFAKPNLSEMALVEDDALLRALMPRVCGVRYSRPRDLDQEIAETLHEAVDDFGAGLNLQKWASTGTFTAEELPYLLHANEAMELMAKVEELDLKMYAAVVPHLIPTKGLLAEIPDAWPWAYGHAVYLRFVRLGGAA
ncbi:hypothetical protein [Paraburkholderia acidipaludis]|uniref:hypothetical protein n=1 Tax=Paraburkholderia acidipaludis TaxID=660537 RepID=UPI0004877A6B|nr:hypothetical protein [Paraburkholderia acidipaludis]